MSGWSLFFTTFWVLRSGRARHVRGARRIAVIRAVPFNLLTFMERIRNQAIVYGCLRRCLFRSMWTASSTRKTAPRFVFENHLFLSFFPPLSFSRVPMVYNPQHVSVEPSGCIGRILQHAPCAYWRRNHHDLREHRDCLRDEEHGLRQGDPVDARLSDRSGDHRLNLWLGAQ